MLPETRSFLLAEVELQIDNVLLPPQVPNDFAKLLNGAVVRRRDRLDRVGSGRSTRGVVGVRGVPGLQSRGRGGRLFEVVCEDAVLLLELVASEHGHAKDISVGEILQRVTASLHAPLANVCQLLLQHVLLSLPALLRGEKVRLGRVRRSLVFADGRADGFELALDFRQALDIFRMCDELALVFFVRIASDLSLAAHIVLRCNLGIASLLVGRAQGGHAIFERLALLFESNAFRLDLSVQVRVLVVGSGEVRGDGVKAFPQAGEFALFKKGILALASPESSAENAAYILLGGSCIHRSLVLLVRRGDFLQTDTLGLGDDLVLLDVFLGAFELSLDRSELVPERA